MATTYATVADFEAYVEGWVTDNAAALERVLLRAERDVDLILGAWDRDPLTGLKWSPATELTAVEAAALRDATCAQAEYRIEQGENFFVRSRPETVSGPDFTIKVPGGEPYIGPKVWVELARAPRLRQAVGLGRAVI